MTGTTTKVDAKLELLRVKLAHEAEGIERELNTTANGDLKTIRRGRVQGLQIAIRLLDEVQERVK